MVEKFHATGLVLGKRRHENDILGDIGALLEANTKNCYSA
jgi:hypothetical protein